MSLRTDAHELAGAIFTTAGDAQNVVSTLGVIALEQRLHELAGRAEKIARLIPQPEEAGSPEHHREHLARSLKGQPVGVGDMHGEPLLYGDRVRVYDSDRYGEPTGIVVGSGPYDHDKDRVTIKLDSGENDEYTPSVGRVVKIAPFDQHIGEELSDANDHMSAKLRGIPTPGGVTLVIRFGVGAEHG